MIKEEGLPIFLTYEDGSKFEGCLKNGDRHGLGIMTHANGEVYEGNYKNNRAYGYGEYRFIDGAIYIGEFKNNQMHGMGRLTQNLELYEGMFKKGKKEGKVSLSSSTYLPTCNYN